VEHLTRLHYNACLMTRVKEADSYKHSSLLRNEVNYRCKKRFMIQAGGFSYNPIYSCKLHGVSKSVVTL
jgi:hypothetical protein